jgi:DNA-binding transcriptional regulator GbsR (MarR family)
MSETRELSVDELNFIEEISLLIGESGLPRSVGKVLGFLLVCQPEYQPSDAIQQALHLSSGSASTATTLLRKIELIKPVTFPGNRRTYYRLDSECWNRLLQLRIQQAERGRTLAHKGLSIQPGNARIAGMSALYDKSINVMKQISLQ